MSEQQKKVAFNIAQWLGSKAQGVEEIDVAIQMICQHFGIDISNPEQKTKYSLPQGTTLSDLFSPSTTTTTTPLPSTSTTTSSESFDGVGFAKFLELLKQKDFFKGINTGTPEYEHRMAMAREHFSKKSKQQQQKSREEEEEEQTKAKEAETHKLEGNKALQSGNYELAILEYTKAIEIWPKSAIFLSNRAAAHLHLHNYDFAISDCERAVSIDPKYTKAYTRCASALFSLQRYRDAIIWYDRALEIEPSNEDIMKNKAECMEALNLSSSIPSPTSQPPPPPQQQQQPQPSSGGNIFEQMLNNPVLRNAAENFANQNGVNANANAGSNHATGGFEGLGGGLGSIANILQQPGISQLMQSPEFTQMATQMMNNPQLMSSLLGSFGGLGGGGNGGNTTQNHTDNTGNATGTGSNCQQNQQSQQQPNPPQ